MSVGITKPKCLISITVGIGGTILLTMLVLLIVGAVIIIHKKCQNGKTKTHLNLLSKILVLFLGANNTDAPTESGDPSTTSSFNVKENVAYGTTAADSTIHTSDNVAYVQTESATQSTKEINSSDAYDTVRNFRT